MSQNIMEVVVATEIETRVFLWNPFLMFYYLLIIINSLFN